MRRRIAAPVTQTADVLDEWRAAAKRVARAWNAWLAADRQDRAERRRAHHAYVEALEAEERAARRLAGGTAVEADAM